MIWRPLAQHLRTTRTLILFALSLLPLVGNGAGLLIPQGAQQTLHMATHDVNVTIQDGFAVTRVTQTFKNPGAQVTDAHYRFPLPSGASVGQFTYWIAGTPIHAEVVEKQKANEIYQQEQQAGRKVAVSEQQGFQHFDIRVANIQPGEDVKIELVYLQTADLDHGIGRYVYPLEDGGTDEEQKAFWTMDEQVTERFSFRAEVRSSYPIDALRVPQQPNAQISQASPQEWSIHLGQDEEGFQAPGTNTTQSLNKDVVFYWRLQQGAPGGLDVITYKESKDSRGTFMLTLTPADDLQSIHRGTDWTLVLDISGSMNGKFQTLLEGIRRGLSKFEAQDRVRVIVFNGAATDLTGGYVATTPANTARLISQLEGIRPDGGTNLMAGIQLALNGLDSDRTSAIWLVTDGVANVGETQQKAFLKLLKTKDIRLFTFIMGNSANRPLLEGMTKATNGFAIEVSNSDDILGQLENAASKVSHEALHGVKVSFKGLKVTDVEPREPGSLYRGQQLHVFGHYWKADQGEVVVTAKRSGQPIEYRIPVTFPEVATSHPELERMRAYANIQRLLDEDDLFGADADRQEAIVDLAKEFSLVTPYTSMLVLEEQRFADYGINRTNAKRIAKEEAARQNRANAPVQNHNQATNHPSLSQPRSTMGGGGGALGPWMIPLALLALFIRYRNKRAARHAT